MNLKVLKHMTSFSFPNGEIQWQESNKTSRMNNKARTKAKTKAKIKAKRTAASNNTKSDARKVKKTRLVATNGCGLHALKPSVPSGAGGFFMGRS